jgi:hypothetical protein
MQWSLCNAMLQALPHIEQIHEGPAGYSELPAHCDDISLAENKENSPGGQVTEQRLPVNCSGTRLAADTEEGFLEIGTEHKKLPANSHCTRPAGIERTEIEHRILIVDSNGIGTEFTGKWSSGYETNHDNPTLNHKKTERIVSLSYDGEAGSKLFHCHHHYSYFS